MNDIIKRYWELHQLAWEEWRFGEPKEHWIDENGHLCIRYEYGDWWHYAWNEVGELIWW